MKMVLTAWSKVPELAILKTCIKCGESFWLPDDSPPSARYGPYPICRGCLEVGTLGKEAEQSYLSSLEHDMRHKP